MSAKLGSMLAPAKTERIVVCLVPTPPAGSRPLIVPDLHSNKERPAHKKGLCGEGEKTEAKPG